MVLGELRSLIGGAGVASAAVGYPGATVELVGAVVTIARADFVAAATFAAPDGTGLARVGELLSLLDLLNGFLAQFVLGDLALADRKRVEPVLP